MIDLTPLDVRKKKEDFRRAMRGYDPAQVDAFLDLVADRFEQLVREHRSLTERVESLREQLSHYQERERALNEALLAAQELREEARSQAERDAAVRLREAETHAEAILLEADQSIRHSQRRLKEIRARRSQFIRSFRGLIQRFSEHLELEEARLEAEPDEFGDLLEKLQADDLAPAEQTPLRGDSGLAARRPPEVGEGPGPGGGGGDGAPSAPSDEGLPRASSGDGELQPGSGGAQPSGERASGGETGLSEERREPHGEDVPSAEEAPPRPSAEAPAMPSPPEGEGP